MSNIVGLQITNFMKLQAVELAPNGQPVIIGGPNNAGKTSILKAIEAALGGERHVPTEPIRKGESSASIILETDEYIITRTFTEKGSYISIKTQEGYIVPSPQKLLDKIVGDLTFNPLLVLQMKPKQQVDFVKQIAKLDFSELDKEREAKYDERRIVGRDLASKPIPQAPVKPEQPAESAESLLASLAEAESLTTAKAQAIQVRDEKQATLTKAAADYKVQESKVEELVTQLAQAREELVRLGEVGEKAMKAVDEAQGKVDQLPPPIDTAALREQLKEVTDKQTEIATYDAQVVTYNEALAGRAQLEKKQGELSARIEEIDAEKVRLLKESNLPVDGLSFDDDGLYLNGVPFDQISDSEKLKVSVGLAMTLNPELRIMLINNGSELDENSLGQLLKLAEEHSCQAWIVRVSEGDECSIIIEDGLIREEEADDKEQPDELSL